MSLSDHDQFQPLAISSLEQLKEESTARKESLDPDFGRFKLLFDIPKFKQSEPDDFKAMYDFKKEMEDVVFKPLIEIDEKPDSQKKKTSQDILPAEDAVELLPEEPKLTPEEMGFAQGHEKGLEQGIAQGKAQGYEEGFEKGQEEGLGKGEEQGLKIGYEKGFEQGLAEGKQKGEALAAQEATDRLAVLEQTLKTADKTLELLVDKYEEGIISLIQQIAKKIIMARIEIDDEIIKPMILDALKHLVRPEEITLSVSQDDYEYIEMVKDEFFEQIDSLNTISVLSDPSLQKGDFKIQTSTAQLSSDIDASLEEIFKAMKAAGRR